jgi:hypothetical protein
MRQRLIAGLAAFAIGIVGAVAFTAAPAQASTYTGCTGPEAKVSQVQAESIVKDINPAACLDIQFTDKCDGTTVVAMTNWAFNDNKFTVLTVEVNGKEYTLKGGSSPNTETVTLGPPGVEDLQANLVFRFTAPDGSKITIVKPYGDPWTWEEPKGCVTPSPSPSVTASATPVPSATATASAPLYADCAAAIAAGAAPINEGEAGYSRALDGDGDGVACEDNEPVGNDLPVTGSSNTLIMVGVVLLLLVAAGAEFMRRRRNREPVA